MRGVVRAILSVGCLISGSLLSIVSLSFVELRRLKYYGLFHELNLYTPIPMIIFVVGVVLLIIGIIFLIDSLRISFLDRNYGK